MDEERLKRLEENIDRLLAALDRFAPLLDRLMSGGSVLGAMARRAPTNPFRGGKP